MDREQIILEQDPQQNFTSAHGRKKFVLRRIASLQTGTIGLVIHQEGQSPLKADRDPHLYSQVEGREVRLRDIRRRHIKTRRSN